MNIEFTIYDGYWCIFCNYDQFIPLMEAYSLDITDSAIGAAWSRYWQKAELDKKFGDRCELPDLIGWQYPEASLQTFLAWFDAYLQEIKNRPTPIHRTPILPTENLKPQTCYTGKTIFWTGFCKEDEEERLPNILSACGILGGKSVSKKIDYLVTGPHNSISGKFALIGKQAKARELGISIVPTEIFISNVSTVSFLKKFTINPRRRAAFAGVHVSFRWTPGATCRPCRSSSAA